MIRFAVASGQSPHFVRSQCVLRLSKTSRQEAMFVVLILNDFGVLANIVPVMFNPLRRTASSRWIGQVTITNATSSQSVCANCREKITRHNIVQWPTKQAKTTVVYRSRWYRSAKCEHGLIDKERGKMATTVLGKI
ncbi:hypothetical protein J6590_012318 [Homalodisca vitripennis]|nr:hypothetical protein J6590_012318 [Homalodisca vitripennis]